MDELMQEKGDPWFDDGNVVLLTDTGRVGLKVHRGVLARHSEVFQTMFEIPQPPSENGKTVHGCQVVRMYDLPEQLSNLVKALYDGVTFQNNNVNDFFFVAGILRLSTKYFINHLRTQAIRFLSETWSTTLRGHDQLVERAINSPSTETMSYPYVHPLHVLNLAREVNVRVVVPSALYFLSLYPLSDILRGDHPKLTVEHVSRPSSQLSVEDMKDYTLMFQHRLDVILDFIRRLVRERSKCAKCLNNPGSGETSGAANGTGNGPVSPHPCERAFVKLANRLSWSWVPRTGPLHYMVQAMDELIQDASVCKPCRKEFKRDVLLFREEIWQALPSIVGLPSWEELIKADLPNS